MEKSKRAYLFIACLVLFGILLNPIVAWARMVTYEITGIINHIFDGSNALNGSVVNGDVFTGSFAFDTLTPDSVPADPSRGEYSSTAPGSGIQVFLGDYTFERDPTAPFLFIRASNKPPGNPGDQFNIRSGWIGGFGGSGFPPGWHFEILIDIYSFLDKISSDKLPTSSFDLTGWETFFQIVGGGGVLSIEGFLTSVSVVPYCLNVQSDAQDAAQKGGPYKNHGQMVKTAAHVVSRAVNSGEISEECASCIVSQFGRGIAIADQKACRIE